VARKFLPDVDAIPADVLTKTRLMFLNYPNNPTGAVASLEFFERAGEEDHLHARAGDEDVAVFGHEDGVGVGGERDVDTTLLVEVGCGFGPPGLTQTAPERWLNFCKRTIPKASG
jgi:hypothetical protein